jgi:TRAP-type C4-dicarboxylate transport system substrate-binding protein
MNAPPLIALIINFAKCIKTTKADSLKILARILNGFLELDKSEVVTAPATQQGFELRIVSSNLLNH